MFLVFNSAPEMIFLYYRSWKAVLIPSLLPWVCFSETDSQRGLVPVAVLGQVRTVLLGFLRHIDNYV